MFPSIARTAVRASALRVAARPRPAAFTALRFNSAKSAGANPASAANSNATSEAHAGSGHHAHETESFEAFNSRYETFFNSCGDLFELQRGLNNCFAYDLVPTTDVIEAALKCARKVNDYATAVRILEGVKAKVENKGQYQAYLDELAPTLKDLGIQSKEELYGQ